MLLGLLPAAALLTIFFARYVGDRRAYFVERSYRVLDIAAREIVSRIEGLDAELDLDLDPKLAVPGRVTLDRKSCVPPAEPQPPRPGPEAPTNVRLTAGSNELTLDRGWRRCHSCQDGTPDPPRCGVTDLKIFTPVLKGADLFEERFLVADDGRVLLRAGLQTSSFRNLDEVAVDEDGDAADDSSGIRKALLRFFSGPARPRPNSGERRHWATTEVRSRLISHEQDYSLFCRAIPWSGRLAAPPWAICGTVRSDVVSGEIWRIPPKLFGAGLLLVAAVALAWPHLKLRFLGPQERLRAADVRVVALSTLAFTGLAVAVCSSLYGHGVLTAAFDEDQSRFAEEFERNFASELREVVAQLGVFRRAIEQTEPPNGREQVDQVCSKIGVPRYLYFADLAWIDGDGHVEVNCTVTKGRVKQAASPRDRVGDRQYFRDVQAGRLWHERDLAGPPPPEPTDFAVQSVLTRTTGLTALAVAQPTKAGRVGDFDGVVLITARMQSTIDPILPPGLCFTVIDRNGQVVMHSDSSRNLKENLFEESNHSTDLIGAVTTRRQTSVDVEYYGKSDYRAYVHPLRGTPWTLVVLRNKDLQSTATMATALVWLLMFGSYVVACGTVLTTTSLLRPRYRFDWLWPVIGRIRVYGYATLALLLLSALAVAAARTVGYARGLTILGIPLASVSVFYLILRPCEAGYDVKRWAAITCLVTALVATNVGLFQDAPQWLPLGLFLATAVTAIVVALGPGTIGATDAAPDVGTTCVAEEPGVVPAAEQPVEQGTAGTWLRVQYGQLLVVLLVNVAAFPSLMIFMDAWEGVADALVKRTQLEYYYLIDQPSRPSMQQDEGMWRPPIKYQVEHLGGLLGPPSRDKPCTRMKSPGLLERLACGVNVDPACEALLAAGRQKLSAMVLLSAPAPTASIGALRDMAPDGAGDVSWCWTRQGSRLRLTIPDGSTGSRMDLSGTVPEFSWPPSAFGNVAILMLGMLLVGSAAVLVRFVTTRLFLIHRDLPDETLRLGASTGPKVWLFHNVTKDDLEGIIRKADAPVAKWDLREQSDPAKVAVPAVSEGKVLLVTGLESNLGFKDWELAVLAGLEPFVFEGKRVVLVSENDPLWFLSVQFSATEPSDAESRDMVARYWRWTRLLSRLSTSIVSAPSTGTDEGPLGKLLFALCPCSGSAEAWYWRIWATSTKAEKLAMAQLADEGFINPNNRDIGRRLIERGLVVRDPAFQFFDPMFADFVRRAEAPRDLAEWERPERGSGWSRVQTPLAVVLAVTTVFFLLTQPQLYTLGLAVLTGFTTVLPKIVQALGSLSGAKERSP